LDVGFAFDLDAGLALVADLGFAAEDFALAFVFAPAVPVLALVFEAGFLASPTTAYGQTDLNTKDM
jgi:hypothetical protein